MSSESEFVNKAVSDIQPTPSTVNTIPLIKCSIFTPPFFRCSKIIIVTFMTIVNI